jgi:hypothetical protein
MKRLWHRLWLWWEKMMTNEADDYPPKDKP